MRLAIFLIVFVLALPFQLNAADNIRNITVSGISEITLPAQSAIIHLDIKCTSNEMKESHTNLVKVISILSEGLSNIGIGKADIKRSLILQGPEYSFENQSMKAIGFNSRCAIDLYVKDIDKISDVYNILGNYKEVTIGSTELKRDDEMKSENKNSIKHF